MTTLEELNTKLDTIANSQKELLKAITGLSTIFSSFQKVFGLLSSSLGDVAALNPKKMMEEAEVNNKRIETIYHWTGKLFTQIQKGEVKIVKPEVELD